MIGRTANPALNKNTFKQFAAADDTNVMTIEGTVNKTGFMLLLLMASAWFVWDKFFTNPELGFAAVGPWIIVGVVGGLIAALVTIFKKTWSGISAPAYALFEGLFLGGISAMFELQWPGIVMQAVILTMGVLFALLFAYKTRLIKVTENFRLGVVAATGGIFILYVMQMIMGMFGMHMSFLHDSSLLSIGISVVIVVVAAMNLVLDFDFIEAGAEQGAPKYMEWYASFGLMVTLIWLYMEILRLLSKLNSRN